MKKQLTNLQKLLNINKKWGRAAIADGWECKEYEGFDDGYLLTKKPYRALLFVNEFYTSLRLWNAKTGVFIKKPIIYDIQLIEQNEKQCFTCDTLLIEGNFKEMDFHYLCLSCSSKIGDKTYDKRQGTK